MPSKISQLPSGSAAISDEVPVVKAGVTTRVPLSHLNLLTTYAALPAASKAGAVYRFSDSPYVARDNGSSYDYFFNGFRATPLDDTGFSWDNQGGAAIVKSGGLLHLTVPSAVTNLRVRYETAPATPWTLTVLLRCAYFTVGITQYAGIALRDSTGKIYAFYVGSSAALQAVKFTNATTFSVVGMTNTVLGLQGQWHWLRVADTGTNITFAVSIDGVHYISVGSEGRTAFFGSGPTQCGIFGNVDSGAVAFAATFASYLKT